MPSGLLGVLGPHPEEYGECLQRAESQLAGQGKANFSRTIRRFGENLHLVLSVLPNGKNNRQGSSAMLAEDEQSGVTVSLSGTIQNRNALLDGFANGRSSRAERSDAALVLENYLLCKDDALKRIRGAFALVIADPRRKTILFARDRLGFRRLYYSVPIARAGQPCVVFGTDLRALLTTGLVPRRLDRAGFETYVWNGFVMAPLTMVEGVSMPLPGTCSAVNTSDFRVTSRRFSFPPRHAPEANIGIPELRNVLSNAVQRHMDTDDTIGFFLSGGVDSSAVAELATHVGTRRVRTFNVAFEERQYDESGYARAVASALGTEHHEIRLSMEHFRSHLYDALGALDQPSFDALNSYIVSRAVSEAGIGVALDGAGGDDLFGGSGTFVDIPRTVRAGRMLHAFPESVLEAASRLIARWKMGKTPLPPQTRWGKLRDVAMANGDPVKMFQVAYSLFTDRFVSALLAQRAVGVEFGLPVDRLSELQRLLKANPLEYTIAMLELTLYTSDRLLRDMDSVSNAVDLEVRSPLLDEAVLELCSRIDKRTLFHPLLTKRALRDAAFTRVNDSLFNREKAGFELPFEVWCRHSLKGPIDEMFRNAAHIESLGLRPDAVASLWDAFLKGQPGIYWTRIWAIFTACWWCREYDVRL